MMGGCIHMGHTSTSSERFEIDQIRALLYVKNPIKLQKKPTRMMLRKFL